MGLVYVKAGCMPTLYLFSLIILKICDFVGLCKTCEKIYKELDDDICWLNDTIVLNHYG